MKADTCVKQKGWESEASALVLKGVVKDGAFIVVLAATLFIASGRLNWAMGWVYIGMYVVLTAVRALVLIPASPELLAERAQVKEDVKEWDRVFAALVSVYLPLLMLLTAGLDARFGWSPEIPFALQIGAVPIAALAHLLILWAMKVNTFFSGIVRIQKDRGHTVISGGPYKVVRHPGYVGMIVFGFASPLVLGSLWALLAGAGMMCVTIARTVLEDRTLQEELEGYRDYAGLVRYRLLPGIW
jgi:protein-S-isoprenylcysteine O-methyltransferase Ste14